MTKRRNVYEQQTESEGLYHDWALYGLSEETIGKRGSFFNRADRIISPAIPDMKSSEIKWT
jgi:hypothetical protein